jgi:hypothetical protein
MPIKRHSCGYPIINTIPRSVSRQRLILWFDGKKDSPTYGEEIRLCPGCGQKLTLAGFSAALAKDKR